MGERSSTWKPGVRHQAWGHKAEDVDIANNAGLNILFCGILFTPSKSLPEIVFRNFGTLDFLLQISSLYVHLSKDWQPTLHYTSRRYDSEFYFTCNDHLYFLAIYILISHIFCSKIQKPSKDIVTKEAVTDFKKPQKRK